MFHIVVLCGPDGSGKRQVLDDVRKVLTSKGFGNTVRVNRMSIYLASSAGGIKIGLAKKITKSDIKDLLADDKGIEVLICSARTDNEAWCYCDLIQKSRGGYVVLLKRKELPKDRKKSDKMVCHQILACSHIAVSR